MKHTPLLALMLPFLVQSADDHIARQAQIVQYNRKIALMPTPSADEAQSKFSPEQALEIKLALDAATIKQHNNHIKRRKLS